VVVGAAVVVVVVGAAVVVVVAGAAVVVAGAAVVVAGAAVVVVVVESSPSLPQAEATIASDAKINIKRFNMSLSPP
jgi:hypothetical protein